MNLFRWYFATFFIAAINCKRSLTSQKPTTPTIINNCVNSVQSSLDSNICYKIYSDNSDFFTAEGICQDLNGHLASINSTEENQLIETFAVNNISGGAWIWIGGSNVDNDNTWQWTDGTPMDYENYEGGLPTFYVERCLMLNATIGFWFSAPCNTLKPFICKMYTTAPITVCPVDTIQNNENANYCYNISNFPTDYYTAKITCDSDRKLLTDITSDYENQFITTQVNKKSNHTDLYWTGGIYSGNLIGWVWEDGSHISSFITNWAPNQPSINISAQVMCLAINSTDGQWYTANCEIDELTFVFKLNIGRTTTTTTRTTALTSSSANSNNTTVKSTLTSTKTTMKSTPTMPSMKPTATTVTPTKTPDLEMKWYIIGGAIIIVITILTVFLIFLCIRKRKQAEIFQNIQENIRVQFELSPLEKRLSHEDRLKMQLDPRNIIIDFNNVLGRGSNATVYEAFIKNGSKQSFIKKSYKNRNYETCKAALKLPTNFDTDEIETFVRELDALISVGSHPHIITFFGWTLYKETPALITEQAQMNLLTHVKSFRDQEHFPFRSILSILWQISQALEHVATFSMVHRDVASRNILLINGNKAKLSDFGLCCHCDESFTYRASLQKRFPLKWLPIEALVDRIFSEKSDVWSFGVLCYEVFTYGIVPYPAMTNVEMLEFLQAGNRLEKPALAPDAIYDLMLDCWKGDPAERPSFSVIGGVLRGMLENETAEYGYLKLDLKCSDI